MATRSTRSSCRYVNHLPLLPSHITTSQPFILNALLTFPFSVTGRRLEYAASLMIRSDSQDSFHFMSYSFPLHGLSHLLTHSTHWIMKTHSTHCDLSTTQRCLSHPPLRSSRAILSYGTHDPLPSNSPFPSLTCSQSACISTR